MVDPLKSPAGAHEKRAGRGPRKVSAGPRHESVQKESAQLADFTGEHYRTCLGRLHELLRPRAYLEIGTFHGDSLKLAKCASIAVDPQFNLEHRIPGESVPVVCLFQMRSDEFFKHHDPAAILGRPIDFAFLDGMHLVEFLLRDFIHTEKACHARSVIALHDCVPLDLHMAGREWGNLERRALSVHPDWWTGDAWKILPILRQYRPDLTVEVLNAPPTGLVIVRGLDPNSHVLANEENRILEQFVHPLDEGALFNEVLAKIELIETSKLGDMLYKLPRFNNPAP